MYNETIADKIEEAAPDARPVAPLDHLGLAAHIAVAFRDHPHINNVMTHISGANWQNVERALAELLDADRTSTSLSRLARNILQLLCAERGVTGRIVKPYVTGILNHITQGETAWLQHLLQARFAVIDPERHAQLVGVAFKQRESSTRQNRKASSGA